MAKPEPNPTLVKTTLALPAELWARAKFQAVFERSDLRSVVIAALEAYLPAKGSVLVMKKRPR